MYLTSVMFMYLVHSKSAVALFTTNADTDYTSYIQSQKSVYVYSGTTAFVFF